MSAKHYLASESLLLPIKRRIPFMEDSPTKRPKFDFDPPCYDDETVGEYRDRTHDLGSSKMKIQFDSTTIMEKGFSTTQEIRLLQEQMQHMNEKMQQMEQQMNEKMHQRDKELSAAYQANHQQYMLLLDIQLHPSLRLCVTNVIFEKARSMWPNKFDGHSYHTLEQALATVTPETLREHEVDVSLLKYFRSARASSRNSLAHESVPCLAWLLCRMKDAAPDQYSRWLKLFRSVSKRSLEEVAAEYEETLQSTR